MTYLFGGLSLDTETCELRSGSVALPIEPQVLALLQFLVENRERLVSKDEIIERVWKGRIVSEAAISSRIKSARRVVGDDGAVQRVIRTYPKLGFRFVADVEIVGESLARASSRPELDAVWDAPPEPAARPSIAVLPFTALGEAESWIADALPHDLISALSRLRWLFVIARASSFRLRGAEATAERVREVFNVRYALSGAVDVDRGRMTVTVDLCDTRTGGVIWSDRFEGPVASVHEIRERIVQAVVSALELQIPLNEAQAADLNAPANFDAWTAYHLGLHHLYRFNREGTARALALFEQAIAAEPNFARAYAGLSFAHFENAFLGFADDAEKAAELARRAAESGLERDPLDPFCNMVMGRAFWLSGDLEASAPWLERSVQLNPNNAQAKYSKAWTEALLGQGAEGRANADAALRLSPLDPLAYGMLAVRSFSHMVLDEAPQAAQWGERAASAPGAHALIEMTAAVGHAMDGNTTRAQSWAKSARRRNPRLSSSDFLRAFPFREAAGLARVTEALTSLGG